MAKGPSVGERASAFFREHSLSASRKIDIYLSEHMYDLMDKHNLATRSDLVDVDKNMKGMEARVKEVEVWKGDFKSRKESLEHRVELLEKKHGVKE